MQTTKIYFPHPLPITQTPQTLYGWYLRSHETYIIATIAEGQNIGTAWIGCGEHLYVLHMHLAPENTKSEIEEVTRISQKQESI